MTALYTRTTMYAKSVPWTSFGWMSFVRPARRPMGVFGLGQGVRRTVSTQARSNGTSLVYGLTGLVTGIAATGIAVALQKTDTAETPDQTTSTKEQTKRPPSDFYADNATMHKAILEIQAALGPDAVSMDVDDLEAHGHSDWSTSHSKSRPAAVVLPMSTADVSAIARICTKYRVPMIPFGAGSSLEGNVAAPFSGVCIDLSHMNAVVAVHADDMDVVVQPGVNWMQLNEQLRPTGLFLPLDPSPTALIGGMVGTNCSGTNAMRYGTMKDWVLNLTVVLADGTVFKTRHRPRKTSAGYNLNALFTGSEGTLGIVTEITCKLAIVPAHLGVATTSFDSVRDAAAAATTMMRRGIPLAALEMMDDVQMRVINQTGGAGGRAEWPERATLFLKFAGGDEATVQSNMAAARAVAEAHGGGADFAAAADEKTMLDLWSARKVALWAMLSVRPPGTQIWSTDVAVPLSRLTEIVEESRRNASTLGLFATVLGHVGDGNFHQSVMYNPDVPEQVAGVARCVDIMVDNAIRMEGTVSGEHGIGLGKKPCLKRELEPATLAVMRALKSSLDPHWLLNPGKVFDWEEGGWNTGVDV